MEVRPIVCLHLGGHQEIATSFSLLGKKGLKGGAGSSNEIPWEREGLIIACASPLLHPVVLVFSRQCDKMDGN